MLTDEELTILQRKAAAFDGMVKYGLTVYWADGCRGVEDRFGRNIIGSNGTELEAIEAAIRKLEKGTA